MADAMLFEDWNGVPIPRLPGTADGETMLDLEQAVERFRRPPEWLTSLYEHFFRGLIPTAATATTKARKPLVDEEKLLALLHHFAYPGLNAEHFDFFVTTARKRGLDPWSEHAYPRVKPGADGMPQISVGTTIGGLRLLAHRTGAYHGPAGTRWCGPDGEWKEIWVGEEPPTAAKFGVHKKGCKHVLWAVAHWSTYAVYIEGEHGRKFLAEGWRKMPELMITKCAEALALRSAFPAELNGLYTDDEMTKPTPARPRTRPVLAPQIDAPESDEDRPESKFRFDLRLYDLGFTDSTEREAMINDFKGRYAPLYVRDLPGIYAQVIREVKQNPEAFGGQASG